MKWSRAVIAAGMLAAAAATARVKPKGWTTLPWMVATAAFSLSSSVFFFASVNSVVQVYLRGLPKLLEG